MRMTRKLGCLIVAALACLLILTFTTRASAQQKPIKLVFGDIYPVDHEYTKADRYFKKLVEEASGGQIIIDYYPSSQLGSEREMLEATISGAQEIAQTSPGTLATLYPKVGVLELPYLFRDREHYLRAMDFALSIIGEEMTRKTGLRVITWRERAPRQLTTKFPVNKVEDIKGLKIRVSEVPVRMALWRALGANPTPIAMAEVYTSLATGVIGAQENPLDTIYAFKLFEQQKFATLTAHMREIIFLCINEKKWVSLSPDAQKIILEAARKSSESSNKAIFEADQGYGRKLEEKGMKINPIDRKPWMEKARTIWDQFGDKEIYEKIIAIQ